MRGQNNRGGRQPVRPAHRPITVAPDRVRWPELVIIRPETLMPGIRSALLVVALAGTVALVDAQSATPIYRQPNAAVESRVADLLTRMTLEEKVAQLQGVWNRKREIQG